ncbi:unannotated protein [freshwater metagenome]|uniref:Unannotated protein n=1 Tax=freshwater metagenome TaxID=449393 RepID=A0A6J6JFH9_9ZZZZ
MIDVVIHRFGEMQHAAAAEITQVVQCRPAPPRKRIEEHAFTKGIVRDDDLVNAEFFNGLLKDESTRENDVGTTGVHPWKGFAFLYRTRRTERLHRQIDFITSHHKVVQRAWRCASPLRVHKRCNGFRSARRSNGDTESDSFNFAHHWCEHRSDVTTAGFDCAWVKSLTSEEPAGKANRAKFQASRSKSLTLLAHQNFRAAPTDIDNNKSLIKHWHRLQHTNVNKSGLFDPSDHIDNHACFVTSAVNKDVGVLGFAHGTCSNSNNIGIVNCGDLH